MRRALGSSDKEQTPSIRSSSASLAPLVSNMWTRTLAAASVSLRPSLPREFLKSTFAPASQHNFLRDTILPRAQLPSSFTKLLRPISTVNMSDKAAAITLANSEQFYLDSEQGESYLIQVSWPLHWQGHDPPVGNEQLPVMLVLATFLNRHLSNQKPDTLSMETHSF